MMTKVALPSFILCASIAHASVDAGRAERIDLDNGMTLIVHESPRSHTVAITILFGVGDMHDPPGKSGLSHLVEHLLVTAAAGETPARRAEDLMTHYHNGHTAQTASDFTLIGAMIPADRIEAELTDLAARIGDLRITQADLDREKPRVNMELTNMYSAMPGLAAMNIARTMAHPGPEGSRRGGIEAHVESISLEDAMQWHRAHYTASNTIVCIVGNVNAEHVRDVAHRVLAPLPTGERMPPLRPRAKPVVGQTVHVVEVEPLSHTMAAPSASIAYAVPQPGEDGYAAYLVLLGAIVMEAEQRGLLRGMTYPPPLFVAPLDDPTTLAVSRVIEGEPQDAIAALREMIAKAIDLDEARLARAKATAHAQLGYVVGLADAPPALLTMNPYMVALAEGRRVLIGLDVPSLRTIWDALTADDVSRWGQRIFGSEQGAAVAVTLKPNAAAE